MSDVRWSVSRETLPPTFDVSRETQVQLAQFGKLLVEWNSRINLVSANEEGRVATRHIADSLRLVALLPSNCLRAIDLGSGAGFPGLILAIATGIHFDLIESDKRKAAFLQEAIRVTNAPATIYSARIEDLPCAPAALITGRALAPLPKLLALATPLCVPDGLMLFLKGRRAEDEIRAAKAKWTMHTRIYTSEADPASVILRISEVARVS